MRWLKTLFLVSLTALLAGGAGAYLWLQTSLPTIDGTLAFDGLEKPVTVTRDRDGVPHVKAASERDAYFALGVTHAQDRLWQMDFQRRLGQGRLSEVLGTPTLATDRYMRTLGLYRLAEKSFRHLTPETQNALQAYSDGVNAWLKTRSDAWWQAWPIEFYLLRYRPEPWRPADSLVWGRTMGLFLSRNWQEEMLRAKIVRALGKDALDTLLPPYPDSAPVSYASLIGNPLAEGSASNGWVLDGTRTTSGKPLLANDPHLRFRAPGLWYLARVSAPGLDVTGATVPGMPFTVLGHNRDIAWGFTSAETDVQDLFIETLLPDDSTRYATPDGPVPFAQREERIPLRGGDEQVFTVRETRHGPVVSDLDPEIAALARKDEVVALSAASLLPDDRTADALYALNRAGNWQDFREALRNWHSPHQNIFMATRTGETGMISPARIPIRRSGHGDVPSPGADGLHDWTGFIPFERLPQVRNPAGGTIVNANNQLVRPAGSSDWLGRNRTPGYRAARIEEILGSAARHDIDAMTRLQMDSVSPMARDLLPLMAETAPIAGRDRRALALLDGWDGGMLRDRPQPLIFAAWLAALKKAIFADELGELYAAFSGFRTQPVKRALTVEPRWCDNTATKEAESCKDILARALNDAMTSLARQYGDDPAAWRWGDAHQARLDHPVLGRVPVLGTLFNVRLPVDGGSYTVNRAHMRPDSSRAPFAAVHGAGLRAAYDLSELAGSRFMVAPGQSGNLLSPHYGDMAVRWRDGGFVMPGRSAISATVTLVPASR
tara:strand:- start:591 stop:2921 length:2331 start_codon:yes stop_codon:yes gene_type:complete